jgi:hypothetical protein
VHDWQSARGYVDWYRADALRRDYPTVITSHPGVYFFLGVNPYTKRELPCWSKTTIRQRPPGVLVIWDPIFGSKNACLEQAVDLEEIQQAGWREIPGLSIREDDLQFASGTPFPAADPRRSWHVFVSDIPQAAK